MQKISNNDQGYEVIIDVIMKLIRVLSLFFIVLLNFYNAPSQEIELAKKAFKAPPRDHTETSQKPPKCCFGSRAGVISNFALSKYQ